MVEVRNVSKIYGTKRVVDDVSLHIKKQAITSFIGPNGAGKSTLLSIISRLLPKDSGEILIDGTSIHQYQSTDLAKKLSILKQDNPINLRLTVKELVSFGRFPYAQGRLSAVDHHQIEQAMQYMNLIELQNHYLDQLSGGQRQRAFIAMIIAQDTEYILLDEPLNNLDMKHAVQIMKTLQRLVNELGKTICIVIHDINFASCYSDYIIALKEGKLKQEGKTEDMINSTVLKEVYDMDIPIRQINDNKICVYFT